MINKLKHQLSLFIIPEMGQLSQIREFDSGVELCHNMTERSGEGEMLMGSRAER